MRDLRGGVALVTGGARRVGRALSLALAREGMRLAVHYHSADTDAEATVDEIRAAGGVAVALRGDLERGESAAALVRHVVRELGGLDLLVNSAAIMLRTPLGEVTLEAWDRMFALNLRAPFFLAQAAHDPLAARRGCIVNVADLAAFETWPAYIPHTITKAGVVQLTRALARAMAPRVRVNAVAPGPILLPESWSDADAAHLAATTPLQRLGTPADATEAVLYLARAEYVTGEVLVVDGGRHVRT